MDLTDIILKKENKKALSKEELYKAFNGYLKGTVSDEEMTKLLKAIMTKGMNLEEILNLTDIFIHSGIILDLKDIPNTIDKHSTGGVGDKTTLIIGPLAAACGVYVPKMSGRGLGHTGGTIDKLESFKGFKTDISTVNFVALVKKNGFAVCSQNKLLVPMDAKVYALRDVTGTTNSIPLIAVSVMSKKIACGAKNILIDVKYGKGALVKTKKEARKLAKIMCLIGKEYYVPVKTEISDMNNPLGNTIGNALEVEEAINVLNNKVDNDLTELCLELASEMVSMAKKIPKRKALKEVTTALINKEAYKKFCVFVSDQGGDIASLKISSKKQFILSLKSGKIKGIDALKMGELSVNLGAGRKTKGESIDHSVGIYLNKKVGDKVKIGDLLCTLYLKENNITEDITSYFDVR